MTGRVRPAIAALPVLAPRAVAPGSARLGLNEVPAGPLPSVRTAIAEAVAVVMCRLPRRFF
ncbi:MAG: hypothetical protein ACRCZP_04815, partial [Phycicoccus sp.]